VRRSFQGLALVVVAFLMVQLSVWLSWVFSIRPDLEATARADRLRVSVVSPLPLPEDERWPQLVGPGIVLRVPPAPRPLPACDAGCRFDLELGVLTVFDRGPEQSVSRLHDLLVPDAGDVRLLRPFWKNWRTITALARRVEISDHGLDSARFRTRWVHGVVTHLRNQQVDRFVIYAFDAAGHSAPTVALSRVAEDTMRRVLGSLNIVPRLAPAPGGGVLPHSPGAP